MADKRINTTTRNEYIHETQNKNLTKSNVYKHDIYVVNENVFFFRIFYIDFDSVKWKKNINMVSVIIIIVAVDDYKL